MRVSMTDGVARCPACGQANKVPPNASGKTVVCGKCKSPLPAGGTPVDVTDATFSQVTGHGAAVVDFWAAWCGPCRIISPVLEQMAAEHPSITFAKLNVDENRATAAQFRVQGIPLLVFLRDGVERGRLVGAVPKSQIEAAIRQHLG